MMQHYNSNLKIRFYFFVVVLSFSFFIFSLNTVKAATLYFSPSSGSYNVGQSFSTSIYVSSLDKAMNAASGTVTFPSDKLEIVSISKANSIFSLWVQEPVFSASAGTLNFEGIVLNPGFSGASGKIISINFKVKAMGGASLVFSNGAILANDGQGSNILTDLGKASFVFEPAISGTQAPKTSTPSGVVGAPLAPVVTSGTHPDPEKWYPTNDPQFNWQVPAGITGVRFSYSSDPRSVPSFSYEPSVISKEYENIPDGVWYFHLQFKNSNGRGNISHFRFQIDTRPPDQFEIVLVSGSESDNPRPTITFETTDSLSGMDYYKIKIGDGDFMSKFLEEIAKDNPYTLPVQAPGKHTLIVQAVDKAGNVTTVVQEFVVSALEPPIIEDYPKELNSGAPLIIKGRTYPNANVNLWIQFGREEPQKQSVRSYSDGNFIYISTQKLDNGVYKLWAEVVSDYDAKSNASETLGFVVRPAALFRIGSVAINALAVIVPTLTLIVVLVFVYLQARRRLFAFRQSVNKESKEAADVIHQALNSLQVKVAQQVASLEKIRETRPLTFEEERLAQQLKIDLSETEGKIKKEIDDINQEHR
ncbi:MAG: hypothetical protein Q8N90_04220 [bacterium]|nr:hypothetical protein [bacterium]